MKTHVANVSEFLGWVKEVRECFDYSDEVTWTPWFRGQSCSTWNLRPALYRNQYGDGKTRKDIEYELREEFIVRAPAYSEGVALPNDEWGWYFLMQHFGTPTRLIDWTEAALVALYFATKENQGLTDAAVWALDPYRLNEIVLRKAELICPNASGVSRRFMNRISRWLPERYKKAELPKMPLAIYPAHLARRMSTQRSGFTIHGSNPGGLDGMVKRRDVLAKVTIPGFNVESIRKELQDCGIDDSTAFPDLDGLSRSLCRKWRIAAPALPHENVLTRLAPSSVNGVGVIAIAKIKKGTQLFLGDLDEILWIDESRIPKGPKEIRALYDDFAPIDETRRHGCPRNFNRLTMSWYINEPAKGQRPNVRGDRETYEFHALRDIQVGEELTALYDEYSQKPQPKKPNKRTQKV